MKNTEYLHGRLSKGKRAYLRHDIEDVVIEYVPTKNGYTVYAKWKGRAPYVIDEQTNLATEATFYGHVITKEEYDKY